MSNIIPIANIAAFKHGDSLAAVSGMLENVWERKTGVTRGRSWSIQNLMLKDATGSIKVTLFGRKDCSKDLEGKQVILSAVTVDDNTHNGKTTRVVKVTEDSGVKVLDNGRGPSPTPTASNSSGRKMVHGATVGMATNKTIDIFISLKKDAEYYAGDQFVYDLHAVASSIIHVSQALEAGQKLEAPKTAPPAHNGPGFNHSETQPESTDDGNFLQEGEEVF